MDPVTVGLGVFGILFGIVMFFLRVSRLEKYGELEGFFKRLGKKGAYTAHLIAYSIIPFLFGIFLIFAGLRGYSLF